MSTLPFLRLPGTHVYQTVIMSGRPHGTEHFYFEKRQDGSALSHALKSKNNTDNVVLSRKFCHENATVRSPYILL